MVLAGKKTTAEDIGQGGDHKLFTGIASLKITHVNPDQATLKTLGYKAEKAPEYIHKDYGRRIDFYLEGKAEDGTKITTKIGFFVKNELIETYIDSFGKASKDKSKLGPVTRKAYKGEISLVMFLKNWLNVPKGSEFSIGTKAIVTDGDIKNIRDTFAAYPDNIFKGLLGVREDKYQSVYGNTLRGFVNDYSDIFKQLVEDRKSGRGDKDNWGPIDLSLFNKNDFALRPYNKDGVTADSSSDNSSVANNATAEEDGNPF